MAKCSLITSLGSARESRSLLLGCIKETGDIHIPIRCRYNLRIWAATWDCFKRRHGFQSWIKNRLPEIDGVLTAYANTNKLDEQMYDLTKCSKKVTPFMIF